MAMVMAMPAIILINYTKNDQPAAVEDDQHLFLPIKVSITIASKCETEEDTFYCFIDTDY